MVYENTALFYLLGFSVERVIQTSERFISHQLTRNGRTYFSKQVAATQPDQIVDLSKRLETETWYYETIQRLELPTARTPKVKMTGPGYFITEWVEGNKAPSLSHCTESEIEPYLGWMASLTAELDNLLVRPHMAGKTTFQPDIRPGRRLKEAIEQGIITEKQIHDLQEIMVESQPVMVPCLQHGDFSPGHMTFHKDGTITLFDAEYASLWHPRLFDLVLMYTKLYVWITPNIAQKFLRLYMRESLLQPEDIQKEFAGVMAGRIIAVCSDAAADRHRKDYTSRAQDLYWRCTECDFHLFSL